MPRASGQKYHYVHQPLAILDQVAPVQNTWYAILDTTEDVHLIFVTALQVHDEAAALNVEVRSTIDGNVVVGTAALGNDAWFSWYLERFVETWGAVAGITNTAYYEAVRGQSVLIEARITSPVGTNQILRGRARYETLELT